MVLAALFGEPVHLLGVGADAAGPGYQQGIRVRAQRIAAGVEAAVREKLWHRDSTTYSDRIDRIDRMIRMVFLS
jgi:hypothetical protein